MVYAPGVGHHLGCMRRWVAHAPLGDVEILARPQGRDEDGASRALLQSLLWAARDPRVRAVLLEVHAAVCAGVLAPRGVDEASWPRVAEELLWAVRSGQLTLRSRQRRVVMAPTDDDAEALGPQDDEPTAWIEIELVDDAGDAVPGIDYRIECDDGRVRTGTTNLFGRAREEGLHAGNCKVSFPKLHGPDWAKA